MRAGVSFEIPAWLVAFLDGVSVWDAVLFLTGIVLLVVFIRKRAWRGVVAFAQGVVNSAKILDAVQGLPEWQRRMEEKIDSIHHEVNYNNGSSVKDSQLRTEGAVERIERSLDDEVKPALVKLAQADDDLWTALDNTAPKEGDDDE